MVNHASRFRGQSRKRSQIISLENVLFQLAMVSNLRGTSWCFIWSAGSLKTAVVMVHRNNWTNIPSDGLSKWPTSHCLWHIFIFNFRMSWVVSSTQIVERLFLRVSHAVLFFLVLWPSPVWLSLCWWCGCWLSDLCGSWERSSVTGLEKNVCSVPDRDVQKWFYLLAHLASCT